MIASPHGVLYLSAKYGAKLPKIVAFGSEMVIDYVENRSETFVVTLIDQPLQPCGTPVAVLRRKWVNPVITPIPVSGKLSNRHELDGSYPEFFQVVQMLDDRLEGPLFRERADMDLIAWVSMKGRAVSEPPPCSLFSLAARSSRRL